MLVRVTQLACELRAELAVLRVQDVLASVLDGDARGREAVGSNGRNASAYDSSQPRDSRCNVISS